MNSNYKQNKSYGYELSDKKKDVRQREECKRQIIFA